MSALAKDLNGHRVAGTFAMDSGLSLVDNAHSSIATLPKSTSAASSGRKLNRKAMRLITCLTNVGCDLWVDTTIDLDKIVAIRPSNKVCKIMFGGETLKTDMPYEKAVALWESYQPEKGVTAKFD